MSNKSGTSNQVISLPQGGGALKGIGEKFSPDLHTGTGNFTVPIALPPGRNGFQPQLNLVYSTGNGNGPFGLGWSLSIPGVSRKTSKGVPRYDDANDTFILSGAEDLVPIEVEKTGTNAEVKIRTRYRPRTEGLFARIDHHHDAKNDYWEVRSKDGLVSFYGTQERPAGASQDWQDPAALVNPDRKRNIFAWKLTETQDPFGNRIEYTYEPDAGKPDSANKNPHEWNQPLIKQIQYGDYTEQNQTKFLVTVTFEYENRSDAFSEYRSGFEIRTSKRCKEITIKTHAGQARPVRTYKLEYENDPHNGVSFLKQIKVVGYDDAGNPSDELPPLKFGYTQFEPEKRDFFPLQGCDLPAQSLGSPNLEMADLFGNGLPDILEMNGTVRYWRNLGDGKFDMPRPMREAPAGLALADPGVQMIDANGDGRIDLLVSNPESSGYYSLRFDPEVPGWDRKSFQRYQQAPSFNLEDPEAKLVDLDGDGLTDIVRSGTRLECFFNDPDRRKAWTRTAWVERKALDEFPNVNFSDPRVKWGDMTGDTLQDIVLVYDGNVEYWPNLGHGKWGKRIHMKNSPRFRDSGYTFGYDPRRILLGDVDGDGLADIVYVGDGKITLWINQSGNAWSDPIEIQGTPSVTDMDAVRLADMLGSGISGVLWSRDATAPGRETMFFHDFTGGIKPYLLHEMDNNMGAVTKVQYAPSTRFYLEDQKQRATRWKTPLPFPVQVVACVEVIDALSKGKLTTEYTYHHGYWDGAEREFRGFGMVEQRDTEKFEIYEKPGLHGETADFLPVKKAHFSEPTLTKTWFHQGPIGEEFGEWQEMDRSSEYWVGDRPVLNQKTTIDNFLKSIQQRRTKRDALRALRGSILRTELYALDGTERQNRPYTVTESLFGLREESPPGTGEADRLRIFFPHALAQRTAQWERGEEPMTQFTFTSDYDQYGQPASQISIAVPRGRKYLEAISPTSPASEAFLATHTLTDYAQRDDAGHYIVDRVARTTTFEIPNDGRDDIFSLRNRIASKTLDDPAKIINQTMNFYDRDKSRTDKGAFVGLPFRQIGDYGALVRTESLVLTSAIMQQAYGNEQPPFLATTGANWTADYPQAFRTLLPALAAYNYHPGGAGSEYATGFFVATERRRYDFHDTPNGKGRGLVLAKRDPLGNDITITYDTYALLPEEVIDPAGLKTKASYNYRVLQPKEVTDPNGNQTRFAFTPIGLLKETRVQGDQQRPSVKMEYDFLAFANREQPIFVRTIRQVYHDTDPDDTGETITTLEYSDGFGRLLQTRTQGEEVRFGDPVFGGGASVLPANQNAGAGGDVVGSENKDSNNPNVTVSGWQTYDNKGRVVEKYEPFFSTGWNYAPPKEAQLGQKATMFYDPRGQVIRTVNPDGSEQRVIYGIPLNLDDPEQFNPTPWEAYTYDANDNAGRTHAADSTGYRHHHDTPGSIVIDALGRTILAVERNRAKPARPSDPLPQVEEYQTASTYDIRGNLLTVTDALKRKAFEHVYDLANRPLRIVSMDAGVRRIVLDAAGNEIERRDSKGALILRAYDKLNRPTHLWARDDDKPGSVVSLRERLLYGDNPGLGLTAAQITNGNLLGKLYRHYDEAGRLTFDAYDFKGNILTKARKVIKKDEILSVFMSAPANNWQVQAYRIDWQPPGTTTLEDRANVLLEATSYEITFTYDALNRVKTMQYPKDADGKDKHKFLRPRYNRAGALESVEIEGAGTVTGLYVQHIAYNAKGQRTLITYGNGVMTRYAYDDKTFRLLRLRTESYEKPAGAELTYHPTAPNQPLQDFGYKYDLAGNIMALHDRTPESGLLSQPERLDRIFTYDPLYRLLAATGRECDTPPPAPPWDDSFRCSDVTRTRFYTQTYTYDAVGNMTKLQHTANGGNFTREFTFVQNTNRLSTMTIGTTPYAYVYDSNGNMTDETTSRHFEWDHSDRMRVFRNQAGNAQPSKHVHYFYDAGGQRVLKVFRDQQGGYEITVYIDGIFEHFRWKKPSEPEKQNNRLHVMDNQSLIALLRVGNDVHQDDKGPEVQYHLGDHLGNSNIVIDDSGNWINREEYFPYGETSLGSFARKRYRFTGKERDEESGLYYHGARSYAPWLARWASCDPLGLADHLNLFLYCSANPVVKRDNTGKQGQDVVSMVPKDNADITKNAITSNRVFLPKIYIDMIKKEENAVKIMEKHFGPDWEKKGFESYDPDFHNLDKIFRKYLADISTKDLGPVVIRDPKQIVNEGSSKHEETVKFIIDKAIERAQEAFPDFTRFQILLSALLFITTVRDEIHPSVSQSIALRDADHYLAARVAEYRTHFHGPDYVLTPPFEQVSTFGRIGHFYYELKKQVIGSDIATTDMPPAPGGGADWVEAGIYDYLHYDSGSADKKGIPVGASKPSDLAFLRYPLFEMGW